MPLITDVDDEKLREECQRAGKHASASLIVINNDERLNDLTSSTELTNSLTAVIMQLLDDIQIVGDNDTGVITEGAIDQIVSVTHTTCDEHIKKITPDLDGYFNHLISVDMGRSRFGVDISTIIIGPDPIRHKISETIQLHAVEIVSYVEPVMISQVLFL